MPDNQKLAFPKAATFYPTGNPCEKGAPGMTLREHYAGLAMQGILAGILAQPDANFPNEPLITEWAVAYADRLIRTLEAV